MKFAKFITAGSLAFLTIAPSALAMEVAVLTDQQKAAIQDQNISARQLRAQTKASRVDAARLQNQGRRILDELRPSQRTRTIQDQSVILRQSRARLLRGRLNRNSDFDSRARTRAAARLSDAEKIATTRRGVRTVSKRNIKGTAAVQNAAK